MTTLASLHVADHTVLLRRAQVEDVPGIVDLLAGAMMTWVIEEAQRRGCALVQLTSDKRRERAHGFYRDPRGSSRRTRGSS